MGNLNETTDCHNLGPQTLHKTSQLLLPPRSGLQRTLD